MSISVVVYIEPIDRTALSDKAIDRTTSHTLRYKPLEVRSIDANHVMLTNEHISTLVSIADLSEALEACSNYNKDAES